MGVISADTSRPGEVPVEKLRTAFENCGMSYSAVARRLGMNESRVRRILTGRDSDRVETLASGERKRYGRPINRIHYDLAVALARAMNVDPVDLGL
jgi:transcriptional regulator with XRE-family HTH domain